MKLYVQQILGVSAVSSVSLNGESDLLIDLNDTRIVLEAKITNSFVKILDTLWDQVAKYLEKIGTNYFVIIAYPENIRQITTESSELIITLV
jgi:hypothetical protein